MCDDSTLDVRLEHFLCRPLCGGDLLEQHDNIIDFGYFDVAPREDVQLGWYAGHIRAARQSILGGKVGRRKQGVARCAFLADELLPVWRSIVGLGACDGGGACERHCGGDRGWMEERR